MRRVVRGIAPLRFVVAASAVLLALAPARAQTFPDQPIRVIVPTQAGGMADILSRVFAQKVKEQSGATVIVENKTGANGVLAADHVAKSPANGLTVLIGFQGTQAVLPHLDAKLPYKPLTDFAPVVWVASAPCVLVVHPSFPAKTVREFVEIVKQKPGGYSYASAGFGTTHHLAAELFKIAADVNLVGVTYRGAAPANQDVIAGHIPIVFDNLGNAMNNIHAGNVRALAITAAERAPQIADVPTMAEAGRAERGGVVVVRAVRAVRHAEGCHCLAEQGRPTTPSQRRRCASSSRGQGVTLPLGTPEALGAHVDAEYKKWGDVVRKANITLPQ
jgi:tripartite-type tricarboxylate transporter receptor subunit TctC